MGKPNLRLNPKVESSCERILLETSASMLLALAMQLPHKDHGKRGQRPHDYRVILVLCILRILLRKTYKDYEIETRRDPRLSEIFGLNVLPSRSTVQRGMSMFSMGLLRQFNYMLLAKYLKPRVNALLDASGIRIVGRSIWYSLKVRKLISRRECDKVHIAVCNDQMLILNWFITNHRKNDSPFFVRLLRPFKRLGIIVGDPGYLSRKNVQFVVDRGGSPFIWIKKNVTARAKGSMGWKAMISLFRAFKPLFKGIYNQRSKVEAVFSALKKRYGDQLHAKKWHVRRKEMAFRFLAYNTKIIIYINYARIHGLNCWVRS